MSENVKPANAAAGRRRARKPRTRKVSAVAAPPAVSQEARYRMIQEAAFLLAEKDGFKGDSCGYWLAAEEDIDAQLGGTESRPSAS